jgi:hypothetical protein
MDSANETIEDKALDVALRGQARKVHIESLLAAALLAVLVFLFPK